MMEHSQPVSQDTPSNVRDILLSENRFGTWFAETIRASGRVCRANRPDTRLLLTSAKLVQKCLAMQELSTQDLRAWCSIFVGSNVGLRTKVTLIQHQQMTAFKKYIMMLEGMTR
jgi:hypothetical protein